FIGNNDAADGYSAVMPQPMGRNWEIAQITHIATTEGNAADRPGAVSDYWGSSATDWILDNPGQFLSLLGTKLYAQVLDREISNNRDLAAFSRQHRLLRFNPLTFGAVFALALVGLTFARRRSPALRAVVAAFVLYALAVSVFFFTSRFRLPLLPIWFVLAGLGATVLLNRWHDKTSQLVPPVLVLILGAAVSFFPLTSLPQGRSTAHLTATGLNHYADGSYQAALRVFRQARSVDSTGTDINLNLGVTFLRLRQADSARQYLEHERRLYPARYRSYANLSALELLEADTLAARELAAEATRLAPYRADPWVLRLRSVRSDQSILKTVLDEARHATRDTLPVLIEAALAYRDLGSFFKAEQLLLKAVNAETPPIETNDLAFRPNFPHAAETFRRTKGTAWYLLGFLSGVRGEVEQAVEYSREAISANPDLAEAYVNLVTGYLTLNKLDRADRVLDSALQRFPDNQQLRQLLQVRQGMR
ncbi:tetratricopeptide repeat protein, partial [candidate division GN15 bacterium]|nr:tetratricopeptide repeat protein [candidate division GN15 bacterium]